MKAVYDVEMKRIEENLMDLNLFKRNNIDR